MIKTIAQCVEDISRNLKVYFLSPYTLRYECGPYYIDIDSEPLKVEDGKYKTGLYMSEIINWPSHPNTPIQPKDIHSIKEDIKMALNLLHEDENKIEFF